VATKNSQQSFNSETHSVRYPVITYLPCKDRRLYQSGKEDKEKQSVCNATAGNFFAVTRFTRSYLLCSNNSTH